MTTSPTERAAESFAAELARWRAQRGLSKKQLATRMGFDPSYVSHIEGRRHRPTEDFARRAEHVLGAGGAIWRCFQEYDELRHARGGPAGGHREPPVPEQWLPPGAGLVVERETAQLSYVSGSYRCTIRRALYNAGTEPVTRYLVRIAVDRYPHDPEQSNRHHRAHPLTFAELNLRAHCGEAAPVGRPDVREPMDWRAKQDRDAFKEVWLHFENAQGRFPLYPAQRTTIEYSYTVGPEKWGQWFQRAVRLPTRQLTVRLDFPDALDPLVWGVETSLSAEEMPLRTPVRYERDGDRARFEWSTEEPPLNARFRLEWRFRSGPSIAVPAQRRPDDGPRAEAGGCTGVVGPGADTSGTTRDAGSGGEARTPAEDLRSGPGGRPAQQAGDPRPGPGARAGEPVDDAGSSPEAEAGEPGGIRTALGVAGSDGPRPGGAADRPDRTRGSELMRRAGIVQHGVGSADSGRSAALLRQPARTFQLPQDADLAREVVARLHDTLDRLERLHVFGKGIGLAAPQIGLPWAAAVVRPPQRTLPAVVLLNPRVMHASTECDEQYEGCLSFFDERGLVPRPLRLDVEHAREDGTRVVSTFERALARLVGHEVDHLEGRLYVDRMAPGTPLVPAATYGGTGQPWQY
ncbi:MAG TPA: peptide deformylase [Pilimelia sp.]|nr:peptide deformylase [Pilimelia sp.]